MLTASTLARRPIPKKATASGTNKSVKARILCVQSCVLFCRHNGFIYWRDRRREGGNVGEREGVRGKTGTGVV